MPRLDRLYSPPALGAPGRRQARRRRRDLTLAGLFVLAMAAVVVGVLMLLAPGLLGSYALRAYFLNADGLNPGIDVMMEGFVVGRVAAVEAVFADARDRTECPAPTAERAPDLPCFRARLSLQQDWPVPVGSVVQLAPAGVFKGNMIRILPGSAAATLAPGSRIATIPRQPDLATQVVETLERAQRTIDETIHPTLAAIQARVQTLLGGMDEEGAAADAAAEASTDAGAEPAVDRTAGLAGVLSSLKQLGSDLEQSIDPEEIAAIIAAVRELTANLAAASATLQARSGDVRDAVQSYGALARDIRGVVGTVEPGVRSSLDDAQYLLQELAAALTPILANIETASRNLAALSADLREDPKSLLFRGGGQQPSPWFER